MAKILTFSVAAYNVGKYLNKLFESILVDELLEEIEILIVNDGSTDNTAEISKQFENQYPGIVRLVNKENGGHGSTINKGIEEASGKYFRALDGDDWINTAALIRLVNELQNTQADLVLTNFLKCYDDKRIVVEKFEGLDNGKTYDFDEVASKVGWMRYHTVIYKTSILKEHHIRLDEHCFYVDSEFMLYPIPYISNIIFYDLDVYCYRLGLSDQSVSPKSRMKHSADSYKVSQSLFAFYRRLPGSLSDLKRKYIADGIAGHCVWHLRTIMTFKPSKEKKQELLEYDNQIKVCSLDIYNGMERLGNTSRLIKILRLSNYRLYKVVALLKQAKNNMRER